MSVKLKSQARREAWLTGIGSIVRLSGDPDDFKDLQGQHFESDWHALSSDVESIGADIKTVLYQAILKLPPEEKRLLADKIRKALIVSDTSSADDGPIRRQLMKDLNTVRSSEDSE